MEEYIAFGESADSMQRIGYFQADSEEHALEQAKNAEPQWDFYSCCVTRAWRCAETAEVTA